MFDAFFSTLSTADWIAAIGVSILLLAFVLNVAGVLGQTGYGYPVLNAAGAGIAGYGAWLIEFWPFVVLEGVWCAVSLVALGRILFTRNTRVL